MSEEALQIAEKRREAKITTDGDCSHEIKRHLLLGRKVMTNYCIAISKTFIVL